jgi:hypothetical protein
VKKQLKKFLLFADIWLRVAEEVITSALWGIFGIIPLGLLLIVAAFVGYVLFLITEKLA